MPSSPRGCSPPDSSSVIPLPLSRIVRSNAVPFFLQHDIDPGRLRVTEHIRQGFLKDTKDRRRLLLVQSPQSIRRHYTNI